MNGNNFGNDGQLLRESRAIKKLPKVKLISGNCGAGGIFPKLHAPGTASFITALRYCHLEISIRGLRPECRYTVYLCHNFKTEDLDAERARKAAAEQRGLRPECQYTVYPCNNFKTEDLDAERARKAAAKQRGLRPER